MITCRRPIASERLPRRRLRIRLRLLEYVRPACGRENFALGCSGHRWEAEGVRIVSIGEILWDVIGENEYLGGAPLNFAAHSQKLGHEVFPLSGVGADARGRKALDLLKV